MNQPKKRFVSISLSVLMAFTTMLSSAGTVFAEETEIDTSAITTTETTNNEANPYGLASNTKDGVILHAFCWSFNTIKANLKDIAAAGYTTVQTSPINRCNDSHPNMKIMGNDTVNGTDGCWWWHYQPTEWTIGNYQLGTREEYKALCAEADKYGIKIISDVLPNHTTPDQNELEGQLLSLKNSGKLYHQNGWNDINYGNRKSIITGMMGGLPDVNTEGYDFQKYYMEFVNDVIACGGDGFRYDTAKHIGTPVDETDGADHPNGNNFWPLVTGKQSYSGIPSLSNPSSQYIYGEILQGGDSEGTPYGEYAKYLDGMVASNYGIKNYQGDDMGTLGWALKSKDFATGTVVGFNHPLAGSQGGDGDKLVTWVESHDTYCNANNSAHFSAWEIRMGWALIAARSEGTPLFFNRPAGNNAPNGNYYGNNVLGAAGDNEWKSTEVAAVNRFHNAMIGEGDYMRNPDNNKQILQIDRGTKGTCIINLGGSTSINNATTMADGQYKDQVSGRTFTVSGGRISGQLDGGKIAVIYNATEPVFSGITASPSSGSYRTDTQQVTISTENVSNAQYRIDSGSWTSFSGSTTVTIGSASDAYGTKHTLYVQGTDKNGQTVSETFTYTKVDPSAKNIAYMKKPSSWANAYCYVYNENPDPSIPVQQNAPWPGVAMTSVGNGIYSYEVPDYDNPRVIFTDGKAEGTTKYPADTQEGVDAPGLEIEGSMIWDGSSSWTPYDGSGGGGGGGGDERFTSGKQIYCVKPSNWGSTVYCYAYVDENTNNATWPGVAMTNEGNGIYSYDLPSGWSNAYIIFNDGNNQDPASMQPGFQYTSGKTMAYENGSFTEVQVGVAVTSVTMSPTSLNLKVGETGSLTATVAPSNASDKTLTWKSSNTSVATVINGTVTAKAAGTATITATSNNGKSATATVTVTKDDVAVTSVSVSPTSLSLTVGDTGELTATVSPSNATDKTLTWKSSNTSVATVINGTVTAKAAGTATITATSNNGKVATATVKVTSPVSTLKVSNFSTNKGTSAVVGTQVMLMASAEGGSGSYQYAFKVQSASNQWFTIQNTSSKNTAMWKPSSEGMKTLYVYVKDSTGKVVQKTLSFYVNSAAPLSVSSFSTDKGTSAVKGTAVTLSVSATGGSGSYQYAFKVQSASGTWATIQDTSTKNTATWKASVAGQKTLYAYVKDSTGKVVSKTLSFNVTDSTSNLAVASFTASTGTSAKSGTKVTLSATAKGGTGFYQYAFKVKSANGTWYTIQDTSTQSRATWTTGSTGTKTLYAYVKDSNGKVAQKTLTFTVN